MAVTIKDVAKKAGVSVATVSLALNNSDKVNIDTLKKVHKIAHDLNYVPNARAQALVKRATNTIGLVIPEVINPFFAELAQAIKDTVKKEDYNVILCSTNYQIEEEIRYINMFKSGQVDGAIFASLGEYIKSDLNIIKDLAENYLPVLYIDNEVDENGIIPVIKSDLENAAYQATTHLIRLGHNKIAYIGDSVKRFSGFKKAMKDNGLKLVDEYIFYDYLTIEGGFRAGSELLEYDHYPTGIVCLNDEIALGVIQTLSRGGLKIPDDISICGIDNIRMAQFYNPSLTTVNLPKEKIGKKAGDLILKMMKGDILGEKDMSIIYPTELIVRNSTAKVK